MVRACALAAPLALFSCGSGRPSETVPRCAASSLVEDAAGTTRVSVSVADLFAEASDARAALDHDVWVGPAVSLMVRVDGIRSSDGAVVAAARRRCRLTHDAWEQRYSLQIVEAGETPGAPIPVASPREAVDGCLGLERLAVGGRDAFDPDAGPYELRVSVVAHPVDSEMLHRLRHWLARPDGAAGGFGQLFGTGVGLFVSRSSLTEPDPLAVCAIAPGFES